MTETRVFIAETPSEPDAGPLEIAYPADTLSDVLEVARLRGGTLFTCAFSAPSASRFPQECDSCISSKAAL